MKLFLFGLNDRYLFLLIEYLDNLLMKNELNLFLSDNILDINEYFDKKINKSDLL